MFQRSRPRRAYRRSIISAQWRTTASWTQLVIPSTLERFAPDQINEDVIRPSLTSDREGLPQVHRLNSLLVAIPRYLTKLCFFLRFINPGGNIDPPNSPGLVIRLHQHTRRPANVTGFTPVQKNGFRSVSGISHLARGDDGHCGKVSHRCCDP